MFLKFHTVLTFKQYLWRLIVVGCSATTFLVGSFPLDISVAALQNIYKVLHVTQVQRVWLLDCCSHVYVCDATERSKNIEMYD